MTDDLPEQNIFNDIVRDVRQLLGSDHCEVWRLDRLAGQLHIVAWDGTKKVGEEYLAKMSIDMNDHPVINMFLKNRRPILLRNVLAPEARASYHHQAEAKARGWTSLFSVPLMRHNRIIGMINSYTGDAVNIRNSEHEESIKATLLEYANRVAEAIRNVELSERLKALHEVNQTLASTFDEDNVIRQILSKGLELVGTNVGWLYLVDVKAKRLVFKAGQGIPAELIEREREVGQGITGYVAQKGEPLIVPDVSKSPAYKSTPGLEVNSVIAVPLRRAQETIGALMAKSRFLDAFTDDDLYVLSILATQAAIAIERAKLTRHLQELSHLALTRRYGELADRLVEAVRDLTGAEVNLWMMCERDDEQDPCLRIAASSGDFDASYVKHEFIPLKGKPSITTEALALGQPLFREDVLSEDEEPTFHNMEEARRRGWHSFMAVPLVGRGDDRLGSLSLYGKEKAKFGQPEVELMRTFANQAAIAIQQQRLYGKTHRQARELHSVHKIALKIGREENVTSLLNAIVEEAARLLGGSGGKLYRRIPGQDMVQLVAVKGIDPAFLQAGDIFAFGEGIVGRVINSKKPKIVNDYPNWAGRIKRLAPVLAAVIEVPLLLGEEAIGVLVVIDNTRKRKFSKDDIPVLRQLAQQAALAIHNADLLERERQLRKQAETLREVSSAIISSELKLGEMAERILDGLRQVVEYHKASFQLIRGDNRELLAARGFSKEHIDEHLLRPISTDQLIHRILVDKKPCILSMPSGAPGWEPRPDTADVQSWVGLPLIYRDTVIGLLTLDHSSPGFYTTALEGLLVQFANQSAIAIANARLLSDKQDRIRDLEIVNQIVQTINAKLDRKDLLKTIVEQIAIKLKCSHCTIFLMQKEGNDFLLIPQVTAGPRSEGIQSRRFEPGEGLAGWVFQQDKTLILPDAGTDTRFAPARESLGKPRSMLITPVKVGDRTIGVISADQDERDWFSESDANLVGILAWHAGIAIERAMGLELLQEIGTRIITVEEEETILQRIVSGAIELTHMSAGIIRLISEDQLSVIKSYAHPPDFATAAPRMDDKEGITRQVIDSGEIIIIPDAHKDGRIRPELRDKARALIMAPLKSEQGVIGVLALYDTVPHNFTETERSLLITLASQAAVSIKNAGLVRELRRKNKELEALNEIGRAVSTLNILRISDLVYQQTSRLMDAPNFFLCLYDRDKEPKEQLTFPVWIHNGKPIKSPATAVTGLTGLVIQNRRSVLIKHWDVEEAAYPVKAEIITGRQQSWLGVPLLIAGEVIGVISVQNLKPHAFDEDTQRLLETVANQAAIAIQNTRLIDRIQKQRRVQIEGMKDISKAITPPLQLKRALRGILHWAITLIGGANLGEIRLLDKSSNELVVSAWQGKKIEKEYERITLGKGITGWVAEHKESRLVPDVKKDAHYLPILDGTGSEIAVPMLKIRDGEDELIGVLNIEHPRVNAFTEDDLYLAETIAELAVVAIENTKLFEQNKERTLALQQSRVQVEAANKHIIMNEVAAAFAHRIKNPAGVIVGHIRRAKNSLSADDPKDAQVIKQLDIIDGLIRPLLDAIHVIEPTDKASQPARKAIKQEKVELGKLLQLAMKQVRDSQPNFERRIRVNTRYYGHPPLIRAERQELLDTLVSVIENAVEAITGTGSITISASRGKIRGKVCARVVVSDTGIGIPTENLPKIFELSFTTKKHGLGFGLWRAKTFYKRLGGDIEVKSNQGKGSKFVIKIPTHAVDSGTPAPLRPARRSAHE